MRKFCLFTILTTLLILCLTSCKSLQKEIQADIWLNDIDGYIYRVIKCTKQMEKAGICKEGEEVEERIQKDNPAIEKYLCMHKDDFQKWLDVITKPKEK